MIEAYCIRCRRMVPATESKVLGLWRLADHFRFDLVHGKDTVPCPAFFTDSTITHGMEDPKAAFREGGRRAWGQVGPVFRKRRYEDYAD